MDRIAQAMGEFKREALAGFRAAAAGDRLMSALVADGGDRKIVEAITAFATGEVTAELGRRMRAAEGAKNAALVRRACEEFIRRRVVERVRELSSPDADPQEVERFLARNESDHVAPPEIPHLAKSWSEHTPAELAELATSCCIRSQPTIDGLIARELRARFRTAPD